MRARIIGVKSQMETFGYLFALHLGVNVYSLTDNLSKTLQKTRMSASQGQRNANMTAEVLEKMRTDDKFDKLYQDVLRKSTELNISEPQLPRHRRAPKHFELGSEEPSSLSSPKDYYKRLYFEVLDLAIHAIYCRFDQPGFKAYRQMEELLLKSLRGEDTPDEIEYLMHNYADDVDILALKAQLSLLSMLLNSDNHQFDCFNDIYTVVKQLDEAQKCLISEVAVLIKLILVNPLAHAVGERSFSTARRLKTWLRSTMSQCRFNNLAILHVHKERTSLLDLVTVANEFVLKNDNRWRKLGVFTQRDFGKTCPFVKTWTLTHFKSLRRRIAELSIQMPSLA
ncbi:uncharacterized protein LOC116975625 [Amblyraja radiata]|uniref:uncharacterized protein LOC116975625 n=1 Tax=Amblyraja radiata TaxID=386614 RepID=UPI0014040CD2|nr:uncharacterized protein LOC116975625 [Amblyraja radiata]